MTESGLATTSRLGHYPLSSPERSLGPLNRLDRHELASPFMPPRSPERQGTGQTKE